MALDPLYLEAAPVGRSGTRQARAVMITEFSTPCDHRRSRACPAIVHPGTAVGPDRGPAARPSSAPPAGLPPAPHPRPTGVRQAHPDLGVRLRLPTHRRPQLLGDHPAAPLR